ncbi:bifunctional aminoglycoside phosphotransferase/ATP-binding protein [Roseimaritima ulvae]|uniref:Zeta toxin n=1 Tax=Roseimaritima ulvae TaxID=980254 RepID=A0A5B9QU48_9BACT|nr:bifunctional aminoglycoside phosphotransferase/ATP-binding protein [Roseimaritima ulvae]QEG40566.1 Zeta toxin [Roseimaritima ulvae]
MPQPTSNPTAAESSPSEDWIQGLLRPQAYPHAVDGPVVLQETHISYVLLAGEFAYKIKKSIQTNFLDYRRLADRRRFCHEELRLDRRFAPELYLDVVPIYRDGRLIPPEDAAEPIEYAVKMRRFPGDALLSERIDAGRLSTAEVKQLAVAVADFHGSASVDDDVLAATWADFLEDNSRQLFASIAAAVSGSTAATLDVVRAWSVDYFARHRQAFAARGENGWIRECHGDLHLQNVVAWQGRLMPFDGIEFSERLRWIDVLSDAAFLAMDLAARDHLDLSRTFLNAYLEQTGDHRSLTILRWFLCYRALVRGMVAALRLQQPSLSETEREAVQQACRRHIELAYRYTLRELPTLWITHGVSGSGKTTVSEYVVQRHEAFRLRSDIERKRRFGLSPCERPSAELQQKMYSEAENRQTYQTLQQIAGKILAAGYSVVIDATFLRQHQRQAFWETAGKHGAAFAILDCHADPHTLRQRVADRMAQDDDASDADLQVLEHQLASQQPLTAAERAKVVDIPDTVQTVSQL